MEGGHGVHGRGHAWNGEGMAGVMHSRGHVWQGHAWQGACMAGETAIAASGKHPTGMHSCCKNCNNVKLP